MRHPGRSRLAIALLAVFVCVCVSSTARADEWKWQGHYDFSILHDSNVFETVSSAESDRAARMRGHVDGRCRLSTRLDVAVRCDGGMEIYGGHNEESRFAGDLRLRLESRLSSRLTTGVELHGRNKIFFDAPRGFGFYRATPHLDWRFSKRVRSRLFGHVTWLDHDDGEHFDYRQVALGLACELRLGERFTSELRLSVGDFGFERSAVDYRPAPPDETPVYPWIALAEDQSDTRRVAALTVEFYAWLFVRAEAAVATNRSNAWGHGWDQASGRLLCVKSLPWKLTLRVYWTLVSKDYTEQLEPMLQVRPDSEDEESSHLLADLSRDLGEEVSLRLRVGRYRNESPFRDRYYEKTVVSTGVTRRF